VRKGRKKTITFKGDIVQNSKADFVPIILKAKTEVIQFITSKHK